MKKKKKKRKKKVSKFTKISGEKRQLKTDWNEI